MHHTSSLWRQIEPTSASGWLIVTFKVYGTNVINSKDQNESQLDQGHTASMNNFYEQKLNPTIKWYLWQMTKSGLATNIDWSNKLITRHKNFQWKLLRSIQCLQ